MQSPQVIAAPQQLHSISLVGQLIPREEGEPLANLFYDILLKKMESQGESGGSGGHAGGVVGGVGVAPSNHIYGPASVHLLPCKIHHNGPAPVATYFRPADSRHKGSVEQLGKTDAGGNQERECCDGSTEQEQVKGALGILGADRRKDGQVWEHFEDDGEEHTARFRGRKLV